MNFSPEEKCAIFDKIAECYFERNFGSMSKTDFETLLFSEYLNQCMKYGYPQDDYSLSKKLGITQSRIRSLKERKELKYPYIEAKWQEAFAEAVKNAKCDENDHYVKMIIQDINVMHEVRNFIESAGWYDECSLNKKLLRIPLDCFTEICLHGSTFDEVFTMEAKENIKKLSVKEEHAVKNFLEDFSKEGLKAFMMSASKEIMLSVLQTLPFGGVAKVGFKSLIKIIEGV